MSDARPRAAALALVVALLLGLAAAGCNWHLTSDYRDQLAYVDSVEAPDSVTVGTLFPVRIHTSGANLCWRKGHDDVAWRSALEVAVRPYDRRYIGSGACAQAIVHLVHEVRLTPTRRGTLVLWIARAVVHDSSGVIRREILVR